MNVKVLKLLRVTKMVQFYNIFMFNKKVLLRERKRHTDCRVVSPGGGVDRQMDGWMNGWMDGQTRVKTLPSPILRMRSVIILKS